MSPEQQALNSEEEKQLELLLARVANDPTSIDESQVLKSLITKVYKSARRDRRRKQRNDIAQADRLKMEQSRRCVEEQVILNDPPQRDIEQSPSSALVLDRPNKCYCCKQQYTHLDAYYHLLCPSCSAAHKQRRCDSINLSGKTVLLTGGRIKIGFHLALKMLRDGARVLITSRFPYDALQHYKQKHDYQEWSDRLKIFSIDLRCLPLVQEFINEINATEKVDILVNNAAQTISRPQAYYHSIIQEEQRLQSLADDCDRAHLGWDLSARNIDIDIDEPIKIAGHAVLNNALFPLGKLAPDGQQLDLRAQNSWSLELPDISLKELLEVHVVNTFAPFLLVQGICGQMQRTQDQPAFVVNVSAVEGQFNCFNKTSRHMHTNMAKAGLNMITRTCAEDLAKRFIFMNSVDTGWITEEHPFPNRKKKREAGFVPPLDEIDGASRVYAPIIDGLRNQPAYGKFFKDYQECDW